MRGVRTGKDFKEMDKRLGKNGKAAKSAKASKRTAKGVKKVTYETKVPDFDGIVKRMERALKWSYGGSEDMKTAVPDIRQHSEDEESCLAALKVLKTLVQGGLAQARKGDEKAALFVNKLVTRYEKELNPRLKEADKIRKGNK